MMKKILFVLFTILSFQTFSQLTTDIVDQAADIGISSEDDILRELSGG